MWHSKQTFPFDSNGSHSSQPFWKDGANCTRGLWPAQQMKLKQFARGWFLGQRDDQLVCASQRSVSLGVHRVNHQFILEKFKFTIKRWEGIGENKIGGACKPYSLQSVIPERVEVFSITCVTQRTPNQPQRGDDHTIRSSCKSQHRQDHWQQHLKGKRPSILCAQRFEQHGNLTMNGKEFSLLVSYFMLKLLLLLNLW